VVVSVTHHQLIRFIPFTQVEDFKDQIELLVIDEAALIPSKELEKIDGPFSIFMSSTTSGYEGTGKEFNIKLIEKSIFSYL
jgi:N-acetyltransferase 10